MKIRKLRTKKFYNIGPRILLWGLPTKLAKEKAGNSYWRGRLSTVGLHVLTSLDQLIFTMKILCTFWAKQATLMRRSTVPSLPVQLVFPGESFILKSLATACFLQCHFKCRHFRLLTWEITSFPVTQTVNNDIYGYLDCDSWHFRSLTLEMMSFPATYSFSYVISGYLQLQLCHFRLLTVSVMSYPVTCSFRTPFPVTYHATRWIRPNLLTCLIK
jgi:hypothetical protein